MDGVTASLGTFGTADVGVTSYIKVSTFVAATTSGTTPAFSFQSGADEGDTIQLGISATNASTLRIANINLLVTAALNNSLGAEDAIGQIDNALQVLLTQRANLGAITVRLQEDSSNDATAATSRERGTSPSRIARASREGVGSNGFSSGIV